MSDNLLTLAGNLTADPELRFTPSGAAVTNFTVANTQRRFNKNTNEWEDGDTLFMNCAVWRAQAENAAESLQKGTRVVVTGRVKQRSWETKEGEKRTVIELEVEEVAASLKNATARVTRSGGGNRQSGGGNDAWGTPAPAPAPAAGPVGNDPWGAPGAGNDEPPF